MLEKKQCSDNIKTNIWAYVLVPMLCVHINKCTRTHTGMRTHIQAQKQTHTHTPVSLIVAGMQKLNTEWAL